CGDGVCDAGEDSTNCPQDCEAGGPVCGDGVCDAGEDSTNCPEDCGTSEIGQVTSFDFDIRDQEPLNPQGSMVWMNLRITGERPQDSSCCIFRFDVESLDSNIGFFTGSQSSYLVDACSQSGSTFVNACQGGNDYYEFVVLFASGGVDEDRPFPVRVRLLGSDFESAWRTFEEVIPAQ
ncbi:MAG: hypothetical protein JXQ75_06035, partial [Phycisphaerae bacterium]|nr:hypothetical protein [Phycisphaerae bacterium]